MEYEFEEERGGADFDYTESDRLEDMDFDRFDGNILDLTKDELNELLSTL